MNVVNWLKVSMLASLMIGFVGCSGDDSDDVSSSDAQALCRAISDATCTKLYECLSAEELAAAGFPDTSAACKSQQREENGCDAASEEDLCDGNETFHRSEASKCKDQLESASCSQLRNSDDTADFAPACDKACSVD